VELFEWQVWSGWLMLAALTYGVIPPLILGRLKMPLSARLHDKVLYADAKMNRADWMTALAAMAGIVGIGLGLWWADAVAAIVISLDILHDGIRFMRESIGDLMDESPKKHDESDFEPLIDEVREAVASTSWVKEAAVRLREHGHTITGTIHVVPEGAEVSVEQLERLTRKLQELDWRLQDVAVAPVRALDDAPEDLLVSS
jgi:divalent metal cation (Fe/Co/Zn/Cd) transporter